MPRGTRKKPVNLLNTHAWGRQNPVCFAVESAVLKLYLHVQGGQITTDSAYVIDEQSFTSITLLKITQYPLLLKTKICSRFV